MSQIYVEKNLICADFILSQLFNWSYTYIIGNAKNKFSYLFVLIQTMIWIFFTFPFCIDFCTSFQCRKNILPSISISRISFKNLNKMCIIEVYLLNCYFESYLIYKWHYYDQKNLQSMKYYGILRRYNWSMPYCCIFMRYLCDAA